MPRPSTTPETFWDKVDWEAETECWLWTGAKLPHGYGTVCLNRQRLYAHRYAWAFVNGPIPKGLNILHKCDVPACINPDHLYAGTQRENLIDCIRRGRANRVRGSAHGQSKLTEDQVLELRKERTKGLSYAKLGKHFGISETQARSIVLGTWWKHLGV